MIGAEIVLGQPAFERRFGNLYRSLYRGDEPFTSSFCNASWQFVLKAKSFEWDPDQFNIICNAVKEAGDAEMVWTNLEFAPPRSITCVLPLRYEAYVAAMRNEELGWLYAGRKAIFGPGGSWAAVVDEVTYFAGGFALFGGTTRFINELVRLSGGIEKVRHDFVSLLDDPTVVISPNLRYRLLNEVGWS